MRRGKVYNFSLDDAKMKQGKRAQWKMATGKRQTGGTARGKIEGNMARGKKREGDRGGEKERQAWKWKQEMRERKLEAEWKKRMGEETRRNVTDKIKNGQLRASFVSLMIFKNSVCGEEEGRCVRVCLCVYESPLLNSVTNTYLNANNAYENFSLVQNCFERMA